MQPLQQWGLLLYEPPAAENHVTGAQAGLLGEAPQRQLLDTELHHCLLFHLQPLQNTQRGRRINDNIDKQLCALLARWAQKPDGSRLRGCLLWRLLPSSRFVVECITFSQESLQVKKDKFVLVIMVDQDRPTGQYSLSLKGHLACPKWDILLFVILNISVRLTYITYFVLWIARYIDQKISTLCTLCPIDCHYLSVCPSWT